MFRMIRTVIVGIWFAFAIVFFLPWLILWSLLTRTQDLMYWSSMNAVKIGLRIAGVRVHLEGLENIPPGPCILAANHVSYVDPLAFVPFIPRRVSVALKKGALPHPDSWPRNAAGKIRVSGPRFARRRCR